MLRSRLKKPAHRVALAFPTRSGHFAEIVRGIADYAREHGNWAFTTSGESFELPVRLLRRWRGDGVIAALPTAADVADAKKLSIPVVNFVSLVSTADIPTIAVDQGAIGRLAAEHLLSRGFRRFAFYGFRKLVYSMRRLEAFSQRLAEQDFRVLQHLSPYAQNPRKPWEDELVALGRWISSLPTPIGLFAANDTRARLVADACALVGREVPREVGIIGVDNFHIACEFGTPTLSSIACNWKQLGFDAARRLDQLMRGQKVAAAPRLIPPTGVIARESTNVLIIENPLVARAVEYAKANLSRPFGVKALAQATGVSRRTLELAFDDAVQASPAEYLLRLRVDRALEQNFRKSTFKQIAEACGFSDPRQLRRAMLRFTGKTPKQHLEHARATNPTSRDEPH